MPHESGEGGAEGEGDEFGPEAVDAHGGCCGFVLADGDPGAADAGVRGAVEDHDDESGDDQHEEEVVGEAAEGEACDVVGCAEVEAEEVEVGDGGDSVGAVGDVGS